MLVGELKLIERIIGSTRGRLSADLARHILSLHFTKSDHRRYEKLSRKAQDGTLTEPERQELDDFLNVDAFLAILKARARTFVSRRSPAA
jgi:hypothetical protein